eukprot:1151154-Pelagomonas_calceolata.AAC.3
MIPSQGSQALGAHESIPLWESVPPSINCRCQQTYAQAHLLPSPTDASKSIQLKMSAGFNQ